jgi:hypothetical protein
MYLVHFFDQDNCEFIMSLHSARAAAEAAYEALLRHFVIEDGETLPPKARWDELCDRNGESPHLYKIECDGEPAEEISLSNSEDLATA